MDQIITIRPELLTLAPEQLRGLSPYIWLMGGIVITMIVSVTKSLSPRWPVFLLSVLTAAATAVVAFDVLPEPSQALFNGMLMTDRYANFFYIIFALSAVFTLLGSFRYLDRERLQYPEYYLLVLFSLFGMMLMASAVDLIVIFIALELMSLAVYALVGFRRHDRRSNEAAMKYFILGGAASSILLYGSALLYGATGTTNVAKMLALLQSNPAVMSPLFAVGAWFVLLGFLFKVAAVPFHMWMPDVYEGAPAPVTGFMTTGLKAAAFAAFLRVFVLLGYGQGLTETIQENIHDILWVSAVLTMLVANVIALTQTNLKRLFAYSSIAHSGYLLVGLIAGPGSEHGYAPVVMYLAAYSIMNLGAFILLTIIAEREDGGLNLHDISGLSRRSPWLAFAMAVFMLSLAGIPPTAGFAAKYYLFYSAVQAGETLLVVISVLCSAISVYYYLRVLVYMYMREPVGAETSHPVSGWAAATVAVMVVLTVQIGVLPAKMVAAAKRAVTSL